jgi:hypothetical protein
VTPELIDFQRLLQEVGIDFLPPSGFEACPVRKNSVFSYQHAVRSQAGDVELRYRVDSFARLKAECKALSNGVEAFSNVDINRMYPVNYLAILHNLSGGEFDEPRVFSPESSKVLYGADWNALCFLSLAKNDFSDGYHSAYVSALHKDDIADIYVVTLFKDDSAVPPPFGERNPTPYFKFP